MNQIYRRKRRTNIWPFCAGKIDSPGQEIYQFLQGDLLDGHNGKVYISPPPGFTEDDGYVYQLRPPLYGMPSAARAWHTTMSAYH